MDIEQELREWMQNHVPEDKKNKSRNIEAVLLHYGFGNLPWPTLESIARTVGVGTGTRERARQIIRDTFRKDAKLSDLPTLQKILNRIEEVEFASTKELYKSLSEEGLVTSGTRIRGLLNLAKDLGVKMPRKMVDHNLSAIAREDDELANRIFIGSEPRIKELQSGYKKARTLPGRLGLAKLSYLETHLGDAKLASRIISFIRLSADAEIVRHDGEEWYIFENRDVFLLNSCEKVHTLCDSVEISLLSRVLNNSLYLRSPKIGRHKFDFPPAKVIEKWIEQSKWFEIDVGGRAKFLGDRHSLNDIERSIAEFLKGRGRSTFTEIQTSLQEQGFRDDYIAQQVTRSPLIYVDRSGGRRGYSYQLISNVESKRQPGFDLNARYLKFQNKLKRIALEVGTDVPEEVQRRTEQPLLQKWLFEGKSTEHCAICHRNYAVDALVTAHKKKRAICTDSERTDPWVVFPLCDFGCDHLYESGKVVIRDGVVRKTDAAGDGTADADAASRVDGNILAKQWSQGDPEYFRQE